MTQPGSPVTTVPGFTILDVADPIPQEILLYTLQTVAAERIETVYMTLAIGSPDTNNDVYAVQLRDPANNVLYVQPTPLLNPTGGSITTAFLTWSRQGNDIAQLAMFSQVDAINNTRNIWCNMRLPDLVLAPNSTVWFLSWRDTGSESPDIDVNDATVTTTRDAGAVSGTTTLPPLPLLTPTDGG